MENKRKVWVITGVSRGLGRALARAVVANGDIAIGTTRGSTELKAADERYHILSMELTDSAAVRETVESAHGLFGRIDVLVNNAGYGLLGAVEEANEAEMQHVLDVNVFGPVRVIQAALPLLRAQGFGHIVNISSIAALAPMAGCGLYAAAKCALEGVSQALAQEFAPLGLRLSLVEPGAFRTDFLSAHSVRKSDKQIAAYGATAAENVAYLDRIAGAQIGDPDRGAAAILRLVEAHDPPTHLVLGTDALRRTREKQAQFAADLDAWQGVSSGTDYHATA